MHDGRVLLAGSDSRRRAVVAAWLVRAGFEVCAQAGDASLAIAAALGARPDVALLDANIPGGAVAAVRELCPRLPESRLIVLTDAVQERVMIEAVRAGAVGYLPWSIGPQGLARAIDGALAGEPALPRALMGRVLEEVRDLQSHRRMPVGDGPAGLLTSREWQVVALVRQGLCTREIAERLVVSPITVRTHVNNVMRKLGAASREDLVGALVPR